MAANKVTAVHGKRWKQIHSYDLVRSCPAGGLAALFLGAGVFLRWAGTLAVFGRCKAAAEPGNRQSRMKAARSHARAAFLCFRPPCAPERFRANSEYTPRQLRELRF